MLRVQRDGGTAFALTFAPLDIPAQHEPPPMISPLAVGGVFGEMGFAACAAVQMDETIGTLLALAAISTCVQRAVSVEVSPGWVEPLSVWAWSLAESGSRKTHLQRPMLEPFADWQKRKRDVYRNKIAAARALREAQIQVARCLLAVRRSDRVAAERYAVNAQIALLVIDADTSRRGRE